MIRLPDDEPSNEPVDLFSVGFAHNLSSFFLQG